MPLALRMAATEGLVAIMLSIRITSFLRQSRVPSTFPLRSGSGGEDSPEADMGVRGCREAPGIGWRGPQSRVL